MKIIKILFFLLMFCGCNCIKTNIPVEMLVCKCGKQVKGSFFTKYNIVMISLSGVYSIDSLNYCCVMHKKFSRRGLYQFYYNFPGRRTDNFYYFDGDILQKIEGENFISIENIMLSEGFKPEGMVESFKKISKVIRENTPKI
ncbi:MAG: hypothetical protein Q8880_08750 [Bacteroidota bacterium]|nr:hypothetical protein [Bacteroidota bacterium]